MKIKKKRRNRLILLAILIGGVFYYSPWGFYLFNRTEKNYYYDTENQKGPCLTAIFHTGILWDMFTIESVEEIGAGIYLIPYKFKGVLPKDNYIRLNYIGAIFPIYYKWSNDTLHLRIPFWGIIKNKLSSKVVVDEEPLSYERWGMYDSDTTRNVKERQEWLQMKKEYRSFDRYDLK